MRHNFFKQGIIIICNCLVFTQLLSCTEPSGPIANSVNNIDKIVQGTDVEKPVGIETNNIRESLKVIDGNTEKLNEKLVQANKKIEELGRKNLELKDTNNKILKSRLNWIILTAILGTGISFALFFTGYLKSSIFGIIGIGTVIGAVVMQFYLEYTTYIFIGIAVIGTGLLVYFVIINKKAIREFVMIGEQVKDEKFIGVANEIQSNSTKRIVDKEQEKMGVNKE